LREDDGLPKGRNWAVFLSFFWEKIEMFRNWKSISGGGFVFVLTFFVASVVQADYVYMGTLKQGCADTGCQKTSVSSSSGKNRTSEAYVNLAQAIRSANVQSQKSRPQSSGSSFTNTPTPQIATKTVPSPGLPILKR
jgi:hypothetical protein